MGRVKVSEVRSCNGAISRFPDADLCIKENGREKVESKTFKTLRFNSASKHYQTSEQHELRQVGSQACERSS